MRHIAIIPARAGSKSIPNKNLQKIRGRSLVRWAVDAAKEADFFGSIILSTDIPALFEEYGQDKAVTLRERKERLATDTAVMGDVVLDLCRTLDIQGDDYFWLLQPTAPFRTLEDFERILSLIRAHKPSSVISVKDIGPNHPNRTYTIRNNLLKPLRFTNFENKQALLPVYIRNGAFYVCKVSSFLERQCRFDVHPCVPYIMDEQRSINIDGPLDLLLAQAAAS
jgi:CMP-N-acetylneuraminic acid synthetase